MIRLTLFATLLGVNLLAQAQTTLSGHIKDAQGASIEGAQVRLFRQETGAFRNAISTASGEYRFENVEPGSFALEVRKDGFRTAALSLSIRGENAAADVTLQIQGVNQSVIVTAAGEAQTPDEVSKATSVVSHEEIVNRDSRSLSDILTTVPGVLIRNQGGPGQATTMSIRGLPASAGAILVDGLRFRDASTTQADASSLLPVLDFIDADRVEVLRGSGSSLYGTNAVGGAVNVVTDEGGKPLHGQVQTEGGNLGLFRARGTIGGGAFRDRLKFTAGMSHINVMSGVDGQDAYRSSGLQAFTRYDFTSRMSLTGRFWGSDGFVQTNNSATSSGIPFTNIPLSTVVPAIPLSPAGVKTLLAGGIPDYGNATYTPGTNDPDARRSSRFENAAIVFRDLLTPNLNWQASYQIVHSGRVYENGPVGIGFQPTALDYGEYDGTIHTAGLRATAQLASWIGVTGGYEFERENYFDHQDNNLPSFQRISERTRAFQNSNAGFFAAQMGFFDRKLQLSFSGRAQSFQLASPDFDYAGVVNPYANIPASVPGALTGDASIAYLLPRSNTKLRAHAGNSYRAPSIYERFGAGFYNDFFTGKPIFTPYGDPRLAPDRYNSVDAGVDQYLFGTRARVSATVFYTRVVQIIGFNSNGAINPATDPFGRSSGYINTSGGISRGVELSVEARPTRSLAVSASYTYANADTDSDSQVPGFFNVFDTPRHTISLVATKQWTKRFNTTIDLFHYSRYYDAYVGFLQAYAFPGFTKTNLVSSYRFWDNERKSARFYGKVENLFNQRYYFAGVLAPQATFAAGIEYAF
jgi:vitamin B12 transporter